MATTNYNWATPALGNANNVPADTASLASQIDTTLKAIMNRLPYAMAAGAYSGGSTSQPHTATITFPAGRFSVAPIVSATIDNSAGGTDGLMVTVGTVTNTSMQLMFLRQTGAATANRWCTATWTATQMTPTSAGG